MRYAVLVGLVGACAPSGLVLEVEVESGIASVELFVGDKYCSDPECPTSVLVPDVGRRGIASAYLMTDAEPWTRSQGELVDGYAGFELKSTEDKTLGILVVVGYDGEGKPIATEMFRDVKISPGTNERWRVKLYPTTTLTPIINPQLPGAHSIKLWRGPTQARPSCVLFEHWSDEPAAERFLVVPHDDRDCDEVPAELECAPWTNNASGAPPTVEDAQCLTQKAIADSNVCMLGGPQCFENGMTGQACVPLDTDYCTPLPLCSCAGTAPLDCLRSRLGDGVTFSQMPHLACTIGLDPNGEPCGGNRTFSIDAASFVSTGSTTTCKDMRMVPLTFPLPTIDRSLALAPDDRAYLLLENFSSAECSVDLTWHGTASPGVHYGVFDLALANGRHLAIPMRVELAPTCSGPSSCELTRIDTSDPMFDCVGPVQQPIEYCLPDTTHNCTEGVWCTTGNQNQCCKYGETCGPNGCTCGITGTRCGVYYMGKCEHVTFQQYACGQACCYIDQMTNLYTCPF